MSKNNQTQKIKSPQKQVKFQDETETSKKNFDLQIQNKDYQDFNIWKMRYQELELQQSQKKDSNIWKIRCQELEQQQLQMNNQIELLNYKQKKSTELESRIKIILEQNSKLMGENDFLLKDFNSKKIESEIWKNKYENQMNTTIGIKATYELELKKKQDQIEKNLEQIKILEVQCNQEVEQTKQKYFQNQSEQIQTIKTKHTQNTSLYEEQIRKLQQIIYSRDKDISELKYNLNTIKNENESEQFRLNDKLENLRKQIQQMEIEYQQQQHIIRNKKDQQFDQQIISIKNLHTNEIDIFEAELSKLKILIQSKNDEINMQINSNRIQKENFDDYNNELKQQLNSLKAQIIEINELKEEEITNLNQKLAYLHTNDINELKQKNQQCFNLLNEEIQRLNDLLVFKSIELNDQQNETQQLLNNLSDQNELLKGQIEQQKNKLNEQIDQKQIIISESSNNQQKQNQTYENFGEQMKNQIQFLEDQIDVLKNCIVKKNNVIDENIVKHKIIKNTLEEDIRNLKHINFNLQKQLENCQYDQEKQCEEKDHIINIINTKFNTEIRRLERQIDEQNMQIKLLKGKYIYYLKQKENIYHTENDNKNHLDLKQQMDQDKERQRNTIQKLNEKIIQMDQMKVIEFEEYRKKLENTNNYHINSMKESTQNQINVLTQHLEEHKDIIKNKEFEVQDVLSKQTKLQNMFAELAQNTDKFGPEYQQKIQKLGSEIITTKNIFQIFMQSEKKNTKKQSIQ